jgi:hypothetical protein
MHSGFGSAVTLLEFLAAAARAWIIASNITQRIARRVRRVMVRVVIVAAAGAVDMGWRGVIGVVHGVPST